MKTNLFRIFVSLMLMAAVLMPTATASAALPSGSWVKYGGNPVAPTPLCGVTAIFDPVILVDATDYKMYFMEQNTLSKIYLATSTDGGLTWVCANGGSAVLTPGASGAWDEARANGPTVIKDGGAYKMWYAGRNAAGMYAIGYATSSDGVAWVKYASNPVLTLGGLGAWDSAIIREPSVVLVGGTYHMFYTGTSNWPRFSIGHAQSSDGISWTKNPAAAPTLIGTTGEWDEIEQYAPSVVYTGGVFELFYSGNHGNVWVTGHATSASGDGPWTKDGNAILSPSAAGWDNGDSADYVGVVLDGSTWKMFYSGAGAAGYQIGLATLTNQAQLTFKQLASSVATGGAVVVKIDLNAVTNLYGYQFQVNYDSTKLSAVGAFVNTLVDTTTDANIPPSWSASCSAGICKFAVSKTRPATPVSGSGTVAQITFTGLAAGDVPLTFSNDLLSDRDGGPIAHSTTTGWVTVSGASGTINGTVKLQGRLTPITAGTVTLTDLYGIFPPVTVPFNASTGDFSAVVPVQGGSTEYILSAAHSLYLGNRLGTPAVGGGIVVTAGGTATAATTTLKGGDADNSGKIDVSDLSCIGSAFGGAPTVCGATGSSDINADTTVNILDLVLAGGNFDLTTPQGW